MFDLSQIFGIPRVLFDVNYHMSIESKPSDIYSFHRSNANILTFKEELLRSEYTKPVDGFMDYIANM